MNSIKGRTIEAKSYMTSREFQHRHEIEEVKKDTILPTAESQLFMVERRKTPESNGRSTYPRSSSFARTDGGLVHISRYSSLFLYIK